jgi:branched-chain amino acid aminotransferase
MAQFINYNGEVKAVEAPEKPGDNPAWAHVEGIFETMRIINNKILHADHHFKRFVDGLGALRFIISPNLNAAYLTECIMELCKNNGHEKAARVRLVVFQDEDISSGSGELKFLIESWELNDEYIFNEEGLIIAVYPHATKQANDLSLYKTTGYFPYRHAAEYAREHQLDDCLLLNTYKRICDSSISNIFWIKDQVVHTPPLSEGCIDGAMRKHLLQNLPGAGFTIKEEQLSIATLLSADEVFLTNVIRGIRPVKQFQKAGYSNTFTREIFNKVVAPLTKG